MIVRDVEFLREKEMVVQCPDGGFTSFRYLIEKDNMGFTLTKTVIPVGENQFWNYKNHLEACLCIAGQGVLINSKTGQAFGIVPGTMYALDKNDPHSFRAVEDTHLVCVFNPPLKGNEIHKKDGSY